MMKLPPTVLIQETDFHSAWSRAIKSVLREGVDLVIGDKDNPKHIKDVCAIIELYGNAISQIENHEIHKDFPFPHIDQYCEEFTYDFQRKYMNLDDETSTFSYTYFDRFVNYSSRLPHESNINQLISLREHLRLEIKNSIASNRDQAITWKPYCDVDNAAAPCLQRIWIRYLGDQSVELHLTWRSRDGYGAFQANVIALIDMINREIVRPNDCKIVKIVDFSNSFHIHEYDIPAAGNVKLVPTSPVVRQKGF